MSFYHRPLLRAFLKQQNRWIIRPFFPAFPFNNTKGMRNISCNSTDKSNVQNSGTFEGAASTTTTSTSTATFTVLIKSVSDPSFISLQIPSTIAYVADIIKVAANELKLSEISLASIVLTDEQTGNV